MGSRFASPSTGAAPALRSEFALRPSLWGGLLGGLTHVLLDGIMHADIHPLRPFTDANPLHGIIGLQTLHLFCIGSGVLGVLLLALLGKGRGSG